MSGNLTFRIIAAALGQEEALSEAELQLIASSPRHRRFHRRLRKALGQGVSGSPATLASNRLLSMQCAAGPAAVVRPGGAGAPWVATVRPHWGATGWPAHGPAPPADLSVSCRVVGSELAVTVHGADGLPGVRYQAVLREQAEPGGPSAEDWSPSPNCFVPAPEGVAEVADLRGRRLLLFLAAQAEGGPVALLESPIVLSFE
jgi:hypothetical protein